MLVEQHSNQLSSPNINDTIDSQEINHSEKITLKDQTKKTFFTVPNIIIMLCLIALIGFGAYSFMNTKQDM